MKTKLSSVMLVMAGLAICCSGCITAFHDTVDIKSKHDNGDCHVNDNQWGIHFFSWFHKTPVCQSCQPQPQQEIRRVIMPVPQQQMQMVPVPTQPVPTPRTSYYQRPRCSTTEQPVPVQCTLPDGVTIQLWEYKGKLYIKRQEGKWYNYYRFHEPHERQQWDND